MEHLSSLRVRDTCTEVHMGTVAIAEITAKFWGEILNERKVTFIAANLFLLHYASVTQDYR